MYFRVVAASVVAGLLMFASPAQAQLGAERSASKSGFSFPADGPVKILVFRPDVSVGEQSMGGLNEPNADWTASARQYIGAALDKAHSNRANELILMPELEGEQGALLADYRSLFKAVTNSVMVHKLFPGNRLPTKKESFNWTLGPGAAKLGEIGGGDYGLFIYTFDSYGSAGRKAAQIFGALMGVGISSGVHIGYAGLVDLKTGELVWVNADAAMGGDVRDALGADKRVSQLLEDFPQRAGAVVAAPAPAPAAR